MEIIRADQRGFDELAEAFDLMFSDYYVPMPPSKDYLPVHIARNDIVAAQPPNDERGDDHQ